MFTQHLITKFVSFLRSFNIYPVSKKMHIILSASLALFRQRDIKARTREKSPAKEIEGKEDAGGDRYTIILSAYNASAKIKGKRRAPRYRSRRGAPRKKDRVKEIRGAAYVFPSRENSCRRNRERDAPIGAGCKPSARYR